ncbi:ParB/RepB/Spo0J family partition protein [Phaeocystidibacter luteus]|uniref:ParB/RepB/Spo0J family partition protein n=1 Tax=Phaeocystidibacter luteus TaxID=911197 RepID=A0A6N6RLZ5_9FLAO|nr:ParB/RepB/Spo0J family partition protein [Phaeocystidibacter luteus]KAB2814607.1 ParB/RepB/Spo0J family partition protein [Phaeocystidibacter luteus]
MTAKKKQALGKGLSALLKDPSTNVSSAKDERAPEVVGHIAEVDIDSIEVNPFQPRTHFDKGALEDLSNSIKELGIVQPITVRKVGFNEYQLISGERRFRASKMAGLTSIPAYVRIADDQSMLEMALVENIQRQDLDAIEIALSYKRLIEECDLTQEQMSDRVGKKRSTVTNYLRLLKLQPLIQAGIRDRMLSMGHARALVNVEDENEQLKIYRDIIANDLSVRQVEDRVRQLKEPTRASNTSEVETPDEILELKSQLAGYFNAKVDVKRNAKGKGSLVIKFDSDRDLERIIELINR